MNSSRKFLSHQKQQGRPILDGPSSWWTRNERIRTASEIPFKVALMEIETPPLYQTIAEKAYELQQSGMNARNIAKQLNIDNKTVAKALRWWNLNKLS